MAREEAPAAGGGTAFRHRGQLMYSGIDLVPVQDLDRRLTAQPGLVEEIFTTREISYCRGRSRRSAEHFAARFAAKEAVFKALGTGAGHGIAWTDVEVAKEVGGRPYIRLHGNAEREARGRRVRSIDISLSHAGGLSIASVVLMCEDGGVGHLPDQKRAGSGSATQPKPPQEAPR